MHQPTSFELIDQEVPVFLWDDRVTPQRERRTSDVSMVDGFDDIQLKLTLIQDLFDS